MSPEGKVVHVSLEERVIHTSVVKPTQLQCHLPPLVEEIEMSVIGEVLFSCLVVQLIHQVLLLVRFEPPRGHIIVSRVKVLETVHCT